MVSGGSALPQVDRSDLLQDVQRELDRIHKKKQQRGDALHPQQPCSPTAASPDASVIALSSAPQTRQFRYEELARLRAKYLTTDEVQQAARAYFRSPPVFFSDVYRSVMNMLSFLGVTPLPTEAEVLSGLDDVGFNSSCVSALSFVQWQLLLDQLKSRFLKSLEQDYDEVVLNSMMEARAQRDDAASRTPVGGSQESPLSRRFSGFLKQNLRKSISYASMSSPASSPRRVVDEVAVSQLCRGVKGPCCRGLQQWLSLVARTRDEEDFGGVSVLHSPTAAIPATHADSTSSPPGSEDAEETTKTSGGAYVTTSDVKAALFDDRSHMLAMFLSLGASDPDYRGVVSLWDMFVGVVEHDHFLGEHWWQALVLPESQLVTCDWFLLPDDVNPLAQKKVSPPTAPTSSANLLRNAQVKFDEPDDDLKQTPPSQYVAPQYISYLRRKMYLTKHEPRETPLPKPDATFLSSDRKGASDCDPSDRQWAESPIDLGPRSPLRRSPGSDETAETVGTSAAADADDSGELAAAAQTRSSAVWGEFTKGMSSLGPSQPRSHDTSPQRQDNTGPQAVVVLNDLVDFEEFVELVTLHRVLLRQHTEAHTVVDWSGDAFAHVVRVASLVQSAKTSLTVVPDRVRGDVSSCPLPLLDAAAGPKSPRGGQSRKWLDPKYSGGGGERVLSPTSTADGPDWSAGVPAASQRPRPFSATHHHLSPSAPLPAASRSRPQALSASSSSAYTEADRLFDRLDRLLGPSSTRQQFVEKLEDAGADEDVVKLAHRLVAGSAPRKVPGAEYVNVRSRYQEPPKTVEPASEALVMHPQHPPLITPTTPTTLEKRPFVVTSVKSSLGTREILLSNPPLVPLHGVKPHPPTPSDIQRRKVVSETVLWKHTPVRFAFEQLLTTAPSCSPLAKDPSKSQSREGCQDTPKSCTPKSRTKTKTSVVLPSAQSVPTVLSSALDNAHRRTPRTDAAGITQAERPAGACVSKTSYSAELDDVCFHREVMASYRAVFRLA